MKKKVKIVYFAYLVKDKWKEIIEEQLTQLVEIGLYDIADEIYMSVVSDNNELKKLRFLLQHKYTKIKLKNISSDNLFEYPGIKTFYEVAEDNSIILYFHSKGITSNRHEERKNLFKWTIKNYKEIISNFEQDESLDVYGAIPHKTGFVYFNFFWAKGEYIKNYCKKPKITNNRFYWEEWLGDTNKEKVKTLSSLINDKIVTKNREAIIIYNKFKKC